MFEACHLPPILSCAAYEEAYRPSGDPRSVPYRGGPAKGRRTGRLQEPARPLTRAVRWGRSQERQRQDGNERRAGLRKKRLPEVVCQLGPRKVLGKEGVRDVCPV